jgi:hypothetical protein
MTQHNLHWTQHEVSFGVWEHGKCSGLLRIIPLGVELAEQRGNPDARRYSAYGIYVQVKIEQDGFECTGSDFIHPNQFHELLEMLKRDHDDGSGKVKLRGDDGGIAIHFHCREEGDVSVAGQIPAMANPREYWLAKDPLLLQKRIMTMVNFEFLLEQRHVLESCEELEKLLAYVRAVEESEDR